MSASRCARSRSHSASDSALISWTGELSGPETAPNSLQTLLQMSFNGFVTASKRSRSERMSPVCGGSAVRSYIVIGVWILLQVSVACLLVILSNSPDNNNTNTVLILI